MHIPDHLLHGTICPVTAGVSALGLGVVSLAAVRAEHKPDAFRFGAVSALIFAAQMVNFPIEHGTSGHLLGGIIASSLLGIPFGILSMVLILTLQALFFSDGGLSVLGANVLNMAFMGAGLGGWLQQIFQNQTTSPLQKSLSTGLAAWLAVMLSALACSVELASGNSLPLSAIAGSMLGKHALIGVGEAILTVTVVMLMAKPSAAQIRKTQSHFAFFSALVIGGILSPFASSYPDGLEWVAEKYLAFHAVVPFFVSPMPDYAFPFMNSPVLGTALAGLTGTLLIFAFGWIFLKFMSRTETHSRSFAK